MSTITKSLSLLDYFNEERPALSLSQLVELSGFHKSNTRRYLVDLSNTQLLQFDKATETYRIGIKTLSLAKIREHDMPVGSIIEGALRDLSQVVGESAHCCLEINGCLKRFATAQSDRINRIVLPVGSTIPWHCTSSGLVYLAYCSERRCRQILHPSSATTALDTAAENIISHTNLKKTRNKGYATMDGFMEEGVSSIALPIFDATAMPFGTISVVMPTFRFKTKNLSSLIQTIFDYTRYITDCTMGRIPDSYPITAVDIKKSDIRKIC